jgi:hypothetical protein
MKRRYLAYLLAALLLPSTTTAQSAADSANVLRTLAAQLRADNSVKAFIVLETIRTAPRPLLDSFALLLGARPVPPSDRTLPWCPWAVPLGGIPQGYEIHVEPPRFVGDTATISVGSACQNREGASVHAEFRRRDSYYFHRVGAAWEFVRRELEFIT